MTIPQGYTSQKGSGITPDIPWWKKQIADGEEFRKKHAMEAKWPLWRAFYRGDYEKGTLPINIFYAFMRAMIPRVYFRDPGVSITPRKPGPLHMALSTVLQRVDNKLIRQMKTKRAMKRSVQHTFLCGTGALKLGFGAQYSVTPDPDSTQAPVEEHGKLAWRTEYRAGIEANMPWVASVHPGHLIVPIDLMEFEDTPWVAHYVQRPLEDVMEDVRLGDARKDLKATKTTGASATIKAGKVQATAPVEMVDLYEVRDMRTGKVIVMAPDNIDKHLFYDTDDMQFAGAPSIFPIVFNTDDEVFWGVPDSQILEPQQLEINEINTQIMKHRRLSIVKLLYEKGMIQAEELDKMLSEDVLAGVQVMDIDKIKTMQLSQVPQDLVQAKQAIWETVREVFGFSKNQSGEFNSGRGDTTATEAQIVRQASEIRLDERRDILADTLGDIVRSMHRIIFRHWTDEQVIDVIGPEGRPIFVKFTGDMLKTGQYEVKIDPDNGQPETRATREQKALLLYQHLKTNPLIDPLGLTAFLLHELQGVAFDDMLKGMGLAGGGSPENPISPQEFGNVLGQASQNLPRLLQGKAA